MIQNKMKVIVLILGILIVSIVQLPGCAGDCDCPIDKDISVFQDGEGLSAQDIETLQTQGIQEGWTFTVGQNAATQYSLQQLCGLQEPDNWFVNARFNPCTPSLNLPDYFDWRDENGCTPIKNQLNCGSCWAFATVAPLESAILIEDEIEVDLSEQWLVSCNTDGWGCDGGWWAHDYHMWKTDVCGDTGAVLESDFPYVGYEAPCNCPYPHEYLVTNWMYIGSSSGVPSVDSLKQAIYDYGPISVGIYANDAFHAYTGGVFNSCTTGPINHGVVLIGWDDNQGSDGVWFLRNSWGTSWGEDGYMKIEYGCCDVGYAACYIDGFEAISDIQLTVRIQKITNDPDLGNFDPIDPWPAEAPEWYYRVAVTTDGETKTQFAHNRDPNGWLFPWISEHTWNAQRNHLFGITISQVEVTIKLMDHDPWPGIDDLADISAYPGGGMDDDVSDKRAAIYHGTYDIVLNKLIETDDVTTEGDYTITLGDGDNNAKVWFAISDNYNPIEDLECTGELSWSDIQIGETVSDTFSVKNNGDAFSLLDWEIIDWPDWGTWTFSPKSGTDLTPEDGAKTVTVTVTAPEEKNEVFSGDIKIVNKHNSNDVCTIPVVLKTPVSTKLFLSILYQRNFPLLIKIFQNLFNIIFK